MKDYIVIKKRNLSRFKKTVNKRIQEGYEPIGGIDTYYNRTREWNKYLQAMIKKE